MELSNHGNNCVLGHKRKLGTSPDDDLKMIAVESIVPIETRAIPPGEWRKIVAHEDTYRITHGTFGRKRPSGNVGKVVKTGLMVCVETGESGDTWQSGPNR